MHLYIITGTTQGLGLSLAKMALDEGHLVLSISRKKSISHENLFHMIHDFKKNRSLKAKLTNNLEKMNLKKIKAIHLINNAAIIQPIGKLEDFNSKEIEDHLTVNVTAPILLSSLVLNHFKRKKVSKTFTILSSGAAFNPIVNWSLYCSSKSSLHMFTQCMDLDYRKDPLIKFLGFSPGVMDTGMQKIIRSQGKKFERVQDFISLKENNLLLSTEKVASSLLKLLSDPSQIKKNHYDVREL